jgi:hypothetical protein
MERQIDSLLAAGWHFLVSNSDDIAFQIWRKHAFDCLSLLLGPEHSYTKHFRDRIEKSGAVGVLSDVGVLSAASLSGSDCDCASATERPGELKFGGGAGAGPQGTTFRYTAPSEAAKVPHVPSSTTVSPK